MTGRSEPAAAEEKATNQRMEGERAKGGELTDGRAGQNSVSRRRGHMVARAGHVSGISDRLARRPAQWSFIIMMDSGSP